MSKKFTSFLVLAAAALLLTVPTHAQLTKKAAKHNIELKAGPLKVNNVQKAKAALAKANEKIVGSTFADATLLKAAIKNIESDKASFEKQMETNLSSIINGRKSANFCEFEKIQISMNGVDRQAQTVANHPRRAGEDLVTPPATATVETWYTAAGKFYAYGSSGWEDATSAMGSVNVAIDGNDIYIQGLAYFFKDGWIQGTINGTTATFANAQVVGEDEYGLEYIVGSDNGQTVSENIVFNYSAEDGVLEAVTKYILENSKADEVSPYCYWLTPTFSQEEPAAPEVVTPPAGIEAVDYVMSYTAGSTPVKVAVDGNDVYFQGMSKYIPEAWVKGTKDGNNVTFAGNQYMGVYSGMESYFFYSGATTFVYDAEADTYSATGQVFGVLGGQYYDGNYTNPVLSRVVETAATPANPAITNLKNSNYGWYITFNVPLQDTEGNALVASKLSYEIFTDIQQEVAPLTFTPATHSKLTEDMTVIPYGFTENYDFYATQIYLNDLYSASWNKIGIKSIYTGGGETHETEIQWYTIKPYGEPAAETGENVDALPYNNALATEDAFSVFGVIDSNNDESTWAFDEEYGVFYKYSTSNAADDWLISPAIKLEAGKKYHFAIDASCASTSFPEKFEVLIGTEAKASALTQSVLAATEVASEEYVTYENEAFEVAETGYYHFGIHAISAKNMWRLQVKNFLVEAVAEPTAPAAVADFTATPGAEGALEANLAFTTPAKAVNGSDLTGDVDVKIYRDGELVNTLSGVAAGSAQTWKDTNVEDGKIYTYYVVAANESGDGQKSEKISVLVGQDEYAPVTNIQITGTTASTISFSWDPVTGVNGGYVNAATAKYAVVSAHVETVWFWQVLVIDGILGTVTGQTAGTFDYDLNAGDQEYKYFGVVALKQDAELPAVGDMYDGDNENGGYTWALVGAPYELPMFESFTGEQYHYLWDSNAAIVVDEESSDDDGVALDLLADEAGSYYFESAKININGTANPTLLFHAKSPNVDKLSVYASKDGGAAEPVAEFNLTEDYQTFKVSLANLVNQANYVQFAIVAQLNTPYTLDEEGELVDLGDYVTLDEIRVMDLFQYNLVADIKAPKSVVAGQKAQVVATVTNFGENPVQDYTVTIKAGENVLTTVLGSDVLAPFATDEIPVDFETSIFDEAGDVTLSVTVDYENELYPEDNTASSVIIIKEPAATAPATLTAEDKGKDGVELTWAMPAAARAAGTVAEDFEDGSMGEFTTIDADGDGYSWEMGSAPVSYLVDGASLAGAGHNESQDFVVSGSYSNLYGALTPDNYLVSPKVALGGKFTFWASAQDASYFAEHFGVAVSTAGNTSAADFTMVEEWTMTAAREDVSFSSRRAQGNWYLFEVDLSAYAGKEGYIAIRHFDCTDYFILNIDDIEYVGGAGEAPVPTSFNIYVEQDKVASVEGDKTTYTVAVDKLTAGEHTFAVSAVYANGAESKPVTATITVRYVLWYNVARTGDKE